jgi:hypothetical protein
VLERAKTVRALDRSATAIGGDINEEALFLDHTKLTSKEENGDDVKEDTFFNHSKISGLKLIGHYYNSSLVLPSTLQLCPSCVMHLQREI